MQIRNNGQQAKLNMAKKGRKKKKGNEIKLKLGKERTNNAFTLISSPLDSRTIFHGQVIV